MLQHRHSDDATDTPAWPDRTRLRREWYGPCSAERLPQPCEPLAWRIETVRRNELYVAPLIDAVRARGYHLATVAMDKGSDNSRVMDDTRERGCVPIVCLGKGRPRRLIGRRRSIVDNDELSMTVTGKAQWFKMREASIPRARSRGGGVESR